MKGDHTSSRAIDAEQEVWFEGKKHYVLICTFLTDDSYRVAKKTLRKSERCTST